MNIASLMNQISQVISDSGGGTSVNPSHLEENLQRGIAEILSKNAGQSVLGEVLLVNGNDILLSIGENQLVQAKLQGNTAPKTGQLMTFQIMNTSENKITLTPLYENLNQNSNIQTALKAAGLPLTEQTVLMVKNMMEEGLPIDRQSIYQMNRAMNLNQEISTSTLARMQRLGIPLEHDMIQQFQHYQNYEHHITNSLSDIADSFIETLDQLYSEQGVENTLCFAKDILKELVTEMQGTDMTDEKTTDALKQNLQAEDVFSEKENISDSADPILREAWQKLLKPANNGQETLKEILSLLDRSISKTDVPNEQKEPFVDLLKSKEFQQLLKGTMNRQMLLEPSEVAEEGKVDRLYEKLNGQLHHLSETLSESVRQDTPLARTITNLNQNLDFMNALNQNFTYVQIPLKMYHQNTSGELFVYTNKKSLAQKEGSVRALLHLDMEHLGSVDVHVTMDPEKRVSTKFYLENEASLDLIADHIDVLNERLNKRGYTMSAEFQNREQKTNVLNEILEDNKTISILSGTSFDVRA